MRYLIVWKIATECSFLCVIYTYDPYDDYTWTILSPWERAKMHYWSQRPVVDAEISAEDDWFMIGYLDLQSSIAPSLQLTHNRWTESCSGYFSCVEIPSGSTKGTALPSMPYICGIGWWYDVSICNVILHFLKYINLWQRHEHINNTRSCFDLFILQVCFELE